MRSYGRIKRVVFWGWNKLNPNDNLKFNGYNATATLLKIYVMKKNLLIKLFFTLFISLMISPASHALTYQLKMSEQEIQERVEALMPLTRKNALMTVVVTNPKIALIKATNELSIFANIDLTSLGRFKGSGQGNIIGTLGYDKEQAVFFLANPRIKNLQVNNLPAMYSSKIQEVSQLLLKQALIKYPVYKLKDNDIKQKLAKSLLESVHVENEQLVATLKML